MKNKEFIYEIAKKNNGVVTTSMIKETGISRGILKYNMDIGNLDRVSRGVYILPEALEDEFFSIQYRFKRGVFSLETALYLWGLTDRTPSRYTMTFPKGYNLMNAKMENVKCIQNIMDLYTLGIEQVITPGGNTVNCYSMEKTLCDILRPRMNVDIQVIAEAYKRYMKRNDKNVPLLSEMAKKLHVENKVRSYLEVLL